MRLAIGIVSVLGCLAAALLLAGAAGSAAAMIPVLGPQEIEEALQVGARGITDDEFGAEWRVPLPTGGEIVVTTPFSRLAHAARRAAFRGEPMTDAQREEQLERGRGRLQLLVTMHGDASDFARFYQPVLLVEGREIAATFAQNERTARRLDDGRFAARNLYVFPVEGLPPAGGVTLIVREAPSGAERLRAPLELSRFR